MDRKERIKCDNKYILRAIASVDANFPYYLHKKATFSILHTHFYKAPTSVYLFYTFIQ